ncbi:cation diffusion facilitator family transporter [Sorangium atrum]|uniref:Cation diffusion facilitator family transporter n=1 Tax=Sorangium atrum TaxID=2995308 RepID=A0ABT5CCT8_9BACT|nr:cation diffusion facilitator family transporter [Sorangium aterium]MDC0684253.1 cation diffusion facilitator family transporter [Sorangium aterium]
MSRSGAVMEVRDEHEGASHEHRHGRGARRGEGHDHGHHHAPGSDHGHDHDHGDPHHHDHSHDLRRAPLRRLIAAFALTASFLVVEAAVGWWSKSLALLADAGHMLADAAALGIAIIAQRIAAQARTRERTYGFRRAEVLAAFANGVALALTAIWIFIEAAHRWHAPQAVHAEALAITAALGLIVNVVAALLLSTGEHGHNINTRAALAHVVSDALGSIGAIAAGVLILSFGWTRADPVISAAIGALVLWGGWRLVRDTSRVLMEGSPIEIDLAHVEDTIRSVPGVVDFHDLHVWSISDGFNVLTVHVVLAKGHHGTNVAAAVARRLREKHALNHCTIQPEPLQEEHLVTLRRPGAEAPRGDGPAGDRSGA